VIETQKNKHFEIEVRRGEQLETIAIGAPNRDKAIDKAVFKYGISPRQIVTCELMSEKR
jgi:hypothetical protein